MANTQTLGAACRGDEHGSTRRAESSRSSPVVALPGIHSHADGLLGAPATA